ncbi:hypothetical protein [Spongiimicrobium sp. 2-473A-2-J]|uniref:hypothetical protein n=1 Tax=Eudoraea algarum TaxID=3417568 RepID=UPI003D359E3F
MYYQFFSHIHFLITSKNQHGVHSPFVYSYITQCVYLRSKMAHPKNKALSVLLKSVAYFKAQNLLVAPQTTEVQRLLQNRFPKVVFTDAPADLIYIHKPKEVPSLMKLTQGNRVHNNTVLLINEIHKTREHLRIWRALKNSEQIQVSVDMFYCGALFMRKEQAKEHFKIRI